MHSSPARSHKDFAARRRTTYVVTPAVLLVAGLFLQRCTWVGTAYIHTTMEVVATFLAMLVGVVALVRFYSQKENIFLFLGTGFIGASFLDGYHALVSSPVFTKFFPSPPHSLVPWSGLASRLFLAVLLWLSWVFWKKESRTGLTARVPEYRVFFVVNTWTLACFLFFAVLPLPTGYSPLPVFHRPQEFVPIFFSLLAFTGYLHKGGWKHDAFEHCLVLSIILFMVHSVFMSSSARLYDVAYIGAHLLRLSSYLCMFAGLILAMYNLVRVQQTMLAERAEDLRSETMARKSAEEASRSARNSSLSSRPQTTTR